MVRVLSDCILTLLLDAFKFRYWVSSVKLLSFAVFRSCSLFSGSSLERCNFKWHYVFQLVVTLIGSDCYNSKKLNCIGKLFFKDLFTHFHDF